jgi:formylmethanofuran dehydrogenase subunit B
MAMDEALVPPRRRARKDDQVDAPNETTNARPCANRVQLTTKRQYDLADSLHYYMLGTADRYKLEEIVSMTSKLFVEATAK